MTAPIPSGGPLAGSPSPDPTAVLGRRFLAWVLDALLFVGVVVGLYALQAEYVAIPAGAGDNACGLLQDAGGDQVASCTVLGDRAYVLSDADVGTQTLASLGWFAFFVVLQGVTGGSPGKLLAGVRVVDDEGQRPGIGKSLGRTLFWFIDGAPWIVPLVGPIVALTSTGHRRVGDMAAGTHVVGRADMGRPVLVGSAAQSPVGQSAWGAAPPEWPGGPPTTPPAPERPAPPEPELDIRALDVPAPTARVDEGVPHIGPDPAWWDDPSLQVEPPPAAQPPTGPDDAPSAPEWEPPSAPDVRDPMDEWEPPTSPGLDDESAEPASIEPPPDGHDRSSNAGTAPADVDAASRQAQQPVDEHPGTPPGPAPFAPPGGERAPQDPGARDPWGTGTTGSAGTGSGAGAPRYELPPPQWDEARNTYLQWEPNRQAWLQWDAQRERWKPIDS